MPAQIVPPYTWSRSEQRVKHSVFNAFLLSHDSSNQPHHSCSAIVDSSPGADQSSASSIPCSMRFYDWHGTDESIRISVVAELTCVLTPVLGLFTPAACGSAFAPQASAKVPARATSTTQKCPRVHVPLGLPNCSLSRLGNDTRRRLSRL